MILEWATGEANIGVVKFADGNFRRRGNRRQAADDTSKRERGTRPLEKISPREVARSRFRRSFHLNASFSRETVSYQTSAVRSIILAAIRAANFAALNRATAISAGRPQS
jgi:hypothetical protein